MTRAPARPWPIGADAAAAAAAGMLHALAFAPWHAWWVQWLALAFLVWRLAHAAPARAALLGWLFALGWLLSGIWWLFISMHRYGGLAAWLAALAVLALCAFLALYLAAAAAAWARWRRGRAWHDVPLFAACWLLAEWARATLFTGFPWLASGYAHTDGPMAGVAPWLGVFGIGALSAALSAALALAWRDWSAGRPRTALGGLAAALLLGLVGLPAARDFTTPTGTLSLQLLQPNVPQDEKFATDRIPGALAWVGEQLMRADAQLVIAPETAIPALPQHLPEGYWRTLHEHLAAGASHVLVGVPLGDYDAGYTNSAVGFAPGVTETGRLYRYDKHHLVPFGEFIPPGFRWFVDLMRMPLGDFSRGPLNAPSFEVHGERVAPNICYEDLFGEELAARFADAGAAPTLFANLSNIAWFGPTIAVDQHLQISRMRALEFQRPMVRATNTGATAVIDHLGRVTHAIEPHTRGVLDAQVGGRAGLTPYARWASWAGHLPLGALALAVVLAAAWGRRRRGAP